MDLPKNLFKARLKAGQHQLGLWNSIPGATVTELVAGAGFDWITIDTEHAPTGVTDVLPALQALAGYPTVAPVVRPASNDPVLIKRLLDLGAQTLVVPYVQTPEEAAAAVAAMHYPPAGIRGVAGGTRASRFGRVAGYAERAEEELCLIVQVETVAAMAQLEAIAQVPGVDAVFIGPADLAASMGFPGQPNHPDVCAAVEAVYARLQAIGVPGGMMTLNRDFAQRVIAQGSAFTAVSTDVTLLRDAADSLAAAFTGPVR